MRSATTSLMTQGTPRKRWIWIVLFIIAAGLLISLATSWNVVLVRDYWRMVELANSLRSERTTLPPWPVLILGTLGFIAAIAMVVIFFVRLLREMKLNQLQSEFLANVSHELKTPIASIELTSSLLRAGNLSADESERLWQSHQGELKRLREQVLLILEAARWQIRPEKPLSISALDLEEWLNESMPRWSSLLGGSAELKREGDPLPRGAGLEIEALNLIADNLIDNARKFARDGAPRVTIRTSYVAPSQPWRKPRWKIEFCDQGLGFNPTDSKKIFQRFFRGRTEAPYSIPGTGLGLFLAQSACKSMGVKLEGQSEGRGTGAVFVLSGETSA